MYKVAMPGQESSRVMSNVPNVHVDVREIIVHGLFGRKNRSGVMEAKNGGDIEMLLLVAKGTPFLAN